jgi:hypothetical protein
MKNYKYAIVVEGQIRGTHYSLKSAIRALKYLRKFKDAIYLLAELKNGKYEILENY